jgi:hypothetical protein
VRPAGVGLVSANARLNVAAVAAGAGAAAVGVGLVRLAGSDWVLRLASLLLLVGGVLSLRLPAHVDEPGRADRRGRRRFRWPHGPPVTGPLGARWRCARSPGLLTIFLAFLLRAEQASGAHGRRGGGCRRPRPARRDGARGPAARAGVTGC